MTRHVYFVVAHISKNGDFSGLEPQFQKQVSQVWDPLLVVVLPPTPLVETRQIF